METLKEKELKEEKKRLHDLYNHYGRISVRAQEELSSMGYELYDLGTSKRCYTCSGDVGVQFRARDDKKYFGIGVANRSVTAKNGIRVSVYRAWIKRIES